MTTDRIGEHILVVDDEEPVRTLLRECFALEGYRVSEAKDGAQLTAQLASTPVDLITLDLNLGGENGFDLARQVRATRNVPIVTITGKGDTIDRIVGLELGADDYITKPFHVREVLARVRAVLRRYDGTSNTAASAPTGVRFAFENWILDLDKRELKSTNGDVRELTTAEFNMLVMFVERPARVLSRDNIMAERLTAAAPFVVGSTRWQRQPQYWESYGSRTAAREADAGRASLAASSTLRPLCEARKPASNASSGPFHGAVAPALSAIDGIT